MLLTKLQILGNYGTIAIISFFHIAIYGFCHPITVYKYLCRYSKPHRITALSLTIPYADHAPSLRS